MANKKQPRVLINKKLFKMTLRKRGLTIDSFCALPEFTYTRRVDGEMTIGLATAIDRVLGTNYSQLESQHKSQRRLRNGG